LITRGAAWFAICARGSSEMTNIDRHPIYRRKSQYNASKFRVLEGTCARGEGCAREGRMQDVATELGQDRYGV